ncbi:MAG TPA: hypothetical protein VFS08_10530 [Gemmatimonadaceae bacterium]|nr:hypothetical protein [Gemmatimonadaceae bacterium]
MSGSVLISLLRSRRAARRHATLALLFLAACDGSGDAGERQPPARPLVEPPPAADTATTGAAAASTTVGADAAPCPMAGLWRTCSAIERLSRAGFGARLVADSIRQPGLTIAGRAYQVGGGELQLFLYADTADARREAATARPDDAEPAATSGILRPPAVIHSLNLVALYFVNNDHQLERVQLAITAGLPPG